MQRFVIPGRLDGLNEIIKADRGNRYKGAKQIRGFIDTFSVNRKAPCITVSIYEDGEPLPSVF